MNSVPGTNWKELLQQISHEVLADEHMNASTFVTPAQRSAKWLGSVGAEEQELQQLEQRLGKSLPASYRNFLLTSNGFGMINTFIWRLFPCAEVDWLVNKDEDLIKIWESEIEEIPSVPDATYFSYEQQDACTMRAEYMRKCLMVSDWGDAGFLALNPVVQHEGEWEAWWFANWLPGAHRYRSFEELMNTELQNYKELKEDVE